MAPFQVVEMQLETLKQSVGNNERGFYVMWAMLRYLGIKLEATDALVCIIPFSFISVISTNRFFEWQCKKFKHNILLEMEVIALSSELAAFIVSECLEKRNILHCTVREVQGAVQARAAR